jgi:8-oxo-dGTP pyrophosphatase MutT (NUDIX family)
MSEGAIDPEMRRRFEAAEKIRVGETALRRPALRPTPASLRAHFSSEVGRAQVALENPHVEPRVTAADRARAAPAAVLLGVVLRDPEPTVLITQRHEDISNPGHWVFPGGRAEAADTSPIETALREAHEEVGLDLARVEVLGRLGDYVSHSGFRISPTVALVQPPIELTPQPGEVEAIVEIELSRLLDSSNYFLYRFQGRRDRAHFAMDASDAGLMLTGATVSMCIGFYTELLKTHTNAAWPANGLNETRA